MADFNERFGPSALEQLLFAFGAGGQSKLDQAKWMLGGMNGQQPPMYTGGPSYPMQEQDLRAYLARRGQQ